jgi:hypothetical protein
MLQNFKYFFWGSACKNKSLYGLFSAVADCFLLVTDDLHTVKQLQTVLSSRYELLIVEISCAENYASDLIDNTVCTQWSFMDRTQIKLGKLNVLHDKIFTAKVLCSSTCTLDWFPEQEQKYALMCAYWIKILANQKQYHLYDTRTFDNFLSLPELDSNEFEQMSCKIYLLMYLGQDTDRVDQQIQDLVDENQLLFWKSDQQ